jgi:hypothetical protein
MTIRAARPRTIIPPRRAIVLLRIVIDSRSVCAFVRVFPGSCIYAVSNALYGYRAQGGALFYAHITLLVPVGIEGTNTVIVTVTHCESHKLHCKMQLKRNYLRWIIRSLRQTGQITLSLSLLFGSVKIQDTERFECIPSVQTHTI